MPQDLLVLSELERSLGPGLLRLGGQLCPPCLLWRNCTKFPSEVFPAEYKECPRNLPLCKSLAIFLGLPARSGIAESEAMNIKVFDSYSGSNYPLLEREM